MRGYGYAPHFVEGDDPEDDARADGGDARKGDRRHSAHPARRARRRLLEAARLADDRPAHAEGLDLPEGDRRQARGRLLALASGADERDSGPPRARAHPRRLDEELPARGAVRRDRPPQSRTRRARADGDAPDERQSARQRRRAPARSEAAGLPRLRGRGRRARRRDSGGDARDGPLSARRDEAEPRRRATSACSARTRTTPTAGRTCSR